MDNGRFFKYSPSVWLLPTLLLLLLWIPYGIEDKLNADFSVYGILPRTLMGLRGVLFSPFIHGNFSHIASNTLPLFVLTAALVFFYRNISLKVLFYGLLFSGFITWLIGRNSYHIGASGLIYVLVSFIFFKGLMTQYYRLVALSFAVVLMYGGMIWYVFPGMDANISWEGHLAGLMTGFFFAVYFKTPDFKADTVFEWEKPGYDPSNDKFMQRFDENGNFVNPPPEPTESDTCANAGRPQITYTFVSSPKAKGDDT